VIEAIKELSNKVDIILKQQEKIKTLENKVNSLEQRLEKLEKMVK
jgi:ubiquinone biosynthesis protein UbiJ